MHISKLVCCLQNVDRHQCEACLFFLTPLDYFFAYYMQRRQKIYVNCQVPVLGTCTCKDVAKKTQLAHQQAQLVSLALAVLKDYPSLCFHAKLHPDLSPLSAIEIRQQPALTTSLHLVNILGTQRTKRCKYQSFCRTKICSNCMFHFVTIVELQLTSYGWQTLRHGSSYMQTPHF